MRSRSTALRAACASLSSMNKAGREQSRRRSGLRPGNAQWSLREGPTGPEKEGAERATVLRIGHGVLTHRIALAQRVGRRIVGKQARVVRCDLCNGLRTFYRNDDA